MRCKTFKFPKAPSRPLIIFLPPRRLFKKFDILHVFAAGSFASFLGMLVRLLRPSVRFVLTTDLDISTCLRAKRSMIYKRVILLPMKIADAVVVCTHFEKNFLIELGIQKDKICIIPNGVRANELSCITSKIDRNELVIGFLGKIQPVKGVHRLIGPITRIVHEYLEKVRVIFAGSIQDERYSGGILKKMNELSSFEYWGSLLFDQVDKFYEECNIVLVPSLSEGFPNVPLEAMAAGKAVIASKIFPIDEMIEHGKTGFLVESDEEIYKYIKILLDNPNLIEYIGKNARKKAISYSWENTVAKYENVYKSLTRKAS